MKYRIVCRNRTPLTGEVQDCYYIQIKLFNAFWIDCSLLNYLNTEKWSRTWDYDFDSAEYFLKEMMSKKGHFLKKMMRKKEPVKQKVIKTYNDKI